MATIEEGTIQISSTSSSSSSTNNNNRRKPKNPNQKKQHQAQQETTNEKKSETEQSSTTVNKNTNNLPKIVHHDHPLIKEHISQDEDAELCFICSDPIRYSAYYPCGHVCCSKCSLRLRALIKDKSCTLCRKIGDTVIISEEKKSFGDFLAHELKYKDEKLGILFDDRIVKDRVLDLLKFNCPVRSCSHDPLTNWKDLKKHVQAVHNKLLCDICTRHKTAFTVELEYYTRQTLSRHERDGDDRGFKGHPQCEFCRIRFYSNDELFTHCREKHEKCFICERHQNGTPQYYRDYEKLEQHFEEEHFVCQIPSCKEQKFVVFGTKVELQDHMINQHSEIIGKSKSARRVDIDVGFSGGSRGGRGFGSQLSTIPVNVGNTSGGNGGNGGNGGGNITPYRTTTPALDPDSFPTLGSSIASTPSSRLPANVAGYHSNLPPSDNSPETLKRRLEERARLNLNYDTNKFLKFQEINTKFREGHIDSKMIIFEYNKLFDIKPSQLELLIQELAALYKNLPAKKNALLSAFETWKTKQAYPSLGASKSLPGSRTNLSSSWVPSRTPNVKSALTSSEEFPSLIGPTPKKPISSISSTLSTINLNSSPSSYGSSTSPATTAPSSSSSAALIGASRVIPRPNSKLNTKLSSDSDSFPSLPSSKTKKPPPVRARTPVTTTSVWNPSTQVTSEPIEDPPLSATINSTKKKGKNKQVLLRLGAFEK